MRSRVLTLVDQDDKVLLTRRIGTKPVSLAVPVRRRAKTLLRLTSQPGPESVAASTGVADDARRVSILIGALRLDSRPLR